MQCRAQDRPDNSSFGYCCTRASAQVRHHHRAWRHSPVARHGDPARLGTAFCDAAEKLFSAAPLGPGEPCDRDNRVDDEAKTVAGLPRLAALVFLRCERRRVGGSFDIRFREFVVVVVDNRGSPKNLISKSNFPIFPPKKSGSESLASTDIHAAASTPMGFGGAVDLSWRCWCAGQPRGRHLGLR